MSKGEKAEFVIEPDWAYGKKGVEGRYPLLKLIYWHYGDKPMINIDCDFIMKCMPNIILSICT